MKMTEIREKMARRRWTRIQTLLRHIIIHPPTDIQSIKRELKNVYAPNPRNSFYHGREEKKKRRCTCSVMRFLLGRRASQLGCHTLHKQVDAERSQRDAQPWSGASQVIADDGMLAIRIPGREERSRGNTRLATATESVRRHPCSASTLVILCPKQTTRDARSPFFSFALLCPDVTFQAKYF